MRSESSRRRQATARKNRATPHVASWKAVRPQIAAPASPLGRISRNGPVFPPELYGNIIAWVTNTQDLCNLSLTSRICYAEAQRVLYRIIDLAQNTHAPVLWASTILQYPHKAAAVHALTLRFDMSFLIVPDMLLSSLKIISQALRTLRKLKKLVLIGHPLAMMHPIHTWILDGCTADLEIFHNSVFPPSAVIPFLSRQRNLRQWKQMGVFPSGVVADTVLPHLATLDIHASALTCFRTPRPLVRVRLKIDEWSGQTGDREAIEALSLFGPTLSTLIIEYSSEIPTHLTLVEALDLLAEGTPELKVLVYTTASASSTQGAFWRDCTEQLSKFSKLEVLVLQLQRQLPVPKERISMCKHAFEQCPSLRCVGLRHGGLYSYTRRLGSSPVAEEAEEKLGALISEIAGE